MREKYLNTERSFPKNLFVIFLIIFIAITLYSKMVSANTLRDCTFAFDEIEIIENCTAVIESEALSEEDRLRAYEERVRGYERNDQPEEAIGDLTYLIDSGSFDERDLRDLLGQRSRMFVELGEFESALADLESVLAIMPDDIGTMSRVVDFHRLHGSDERALELALAMRDVNPREDFANRVAVESLIDLGRAEEAYDLSTDLIEGQPDDYFNYSLRAHSAVALGRLSDAVADLEAAIELAETSRSAAEFMDREIAGLWRRLAQVHFEIGDMDLVVDGIDKEIESDQTRQDRYASRLHRLGYLPSPFIDDMVVFREGLTRCLAESCALFDR